MELIDPRSGQIVWSDTWGEPMPPPRADGLAYIERGARTDRTVPSENINALAMIGRDTGITPRLNALAEMVNPVNALYDAGRHSQSMLTPGRTGWERVGDLGGMLSGMAGAVAPMAASSRGAATAADALMEGMAGATLVPRAMAKDFAANEFGGVRIPFAKDGDDVEAILTAKYPGLKISITESPSRGITLNRIEIPKDMRNQGIGTKVMQDLLAEADRKGVVVSLSPSGDFGGSVSRLKKFYERFGFLPNKGKTADYSISESMYRPETSPQRLADK